MVSPAFQVIPVFWAFKSVCAFCYTLSVSVYEVETKGGEKDKTEG